ncbi:UDP-glycosyltransferase UGT5-like [Anopheles marshallii]|uniref:UDP-glycosyltransferase UGT5-like n=1 Tax=Anopheles marshallii TaxID=1521116 RepID=UPI00237B5DDE|nr:UDP-glycosyltransferase UGT5-like [Anopheles marshallii]
MVSSERIATLVTLCLFVTLCPQATSYRILGINTSPSQSHVIVQDALMKELARRGHHVTMVSPYKESEQVPNYRKITVPMDPWATDFTKTVFGSSNSRWAVMMLMPEMLRLSAVPVNKTLRSQEFQSLMKEPEGYDLLITGIMSDAVFGVSHILNCPTIVVCPNAPMAVVNSLVGNPTPVSTIPNMMLGLTNPMSFGQRIANIAGFVFEEMFSTMWKYYQRKSYEELFPPGQYPAYDAVRNNVSLVFLNHHFTKGSPRPYVPAMVEVGGLQIKDKPSPLPEDIRQWIEGAEQGVILFSLGTNLLSSSIPPEMLSAIVETFRNIKQRIIWKWDTQDMPNKPANVMLTEWLPQDDILAHPNVRLFITHGGLGGIAEALFHGVPLVGIPMFGDQPVNLAKVEEEGWAYVLQYTELTRDKFAKAVHEVLHDPRYRDNVQRLSLLFRDRPQSAMDTAVYWTEYVVRHKGARHLRYPGADMNFFERHSLDVVGFLVLLTVVIFKLISLSCRWCCRRRVTKLKKQ